MVATRHCGAPTNNIQCEKDCFFVSLFARNLIQRVKTPLKLRLNSDPRRKNRQKSEIYRDMSTLHNGLLYCPTKRCLIVRSLIGVAASKTDQYPSTSSPADAKAKRAAQQV